MKLRSQMFYGPKDIRRYSTAGSEHSTAYMFNEVFVQDIYSHKACHVCTGDIVLDIGANIGLFSIKAMEMGAYQVHAFEPDPETFEALKINTIDNDHIRRYKEALSYFVSPSVLFHSCHNRKGASSLYTPEEGYDKVDKVQVECTTIDFLNHYGCCRYPKDTPVFIKMDTEGSELSILAGATEFIKLYKPRLAIASYHFSDEPRRLCQFIQNVEDRYVMEVKKTESGETVSFFWIPNKEEEN
jgi:FkbM family methyltransferase